MSKGKAGLIGPITKERVGLGSVDNTADADKPVSTAQQAAIDGKADLSGATFSGPVGVPDPVSGGQAVSRDYMQAALAMRGEIVLNGRNLGDWASFSPSYFGGSGVVGSYANSDLLNLPQGVSKIGIPIPYAWSDLVKITSVWTDRNVSSTPSDIAVWSTAYWGGSGTRIKDTFTADYSGTPQEYIVEQTLDFATTTKTGLLRFIEIQRRGTDASDTSTNDIYLGYVVVQEQ